MSVNTYATITNEQKTFYQKALIKRLIPALHAYEDAQKSNLPLNSGLTVNWRKFESLPVSETLIGGLEEGKTPTGESLSVTAITAEAKQYGDFVMISDILAKAGIDKAMTEGALLCGEQAALLIDTVIINALKAGATKKSFADSELSDAIVQEIVLELKRKNARRFSDGYYHAMISPAQAYSLMQSESWTSAAKYGSIKKLLKGEVGEMHGVRFKESTNISETACYIYGADSYGVVDMEDGAGKPGIITKGFGSAGVEDPLDQRATVGWKNLFVAKVLNANAIYEVTTKSVE
jgi:N4-gp56 family major capsid protein